MDGAAAGVPYQDKPPVPPPPPPTASNPAAGVTPWGAYGTGKRKFKPLAKPKQDNQTQQRLPKAVLQQHCQKLGWSPPKFERINTPAGGSNFRYSVLLDPGVLRGKAAKRAAGGLTAPRTFQLFADEVGICSNM